MKRSAVQIWIKKQMVAKRLQLPGNSMMKRLAIHIWFKKQTVRKQLQLPVIPRMSSLIPSFCNMSTQEGIASPFQLLAGSNSGSLTSSTDSTYLTASWTSSLCTTRSRELAESGISSIFSGIVVGVACVARSSFWRKFACCWLVSDFSTPLAWFAHEMWLGAMKIRHKRIVRIVQQSELVEPPVLRFARLDCGFWTIYALSYPLRRTIKSFGILRQREVQSTQKCSYKRSTPTN